MVMKMDASFSRDDRLSRRLLAQRLQAAGYRVAESTLATMAVRGGGPRFSKFGPYTSYLWGDALDWAEARLTDPRTSTSENAA
jgi:hypothetical protein